jgi:ATP-binding cassette subfamily B protein
LNAFFHPTVTFFNAATIVLLMYFGSGMVRSGELSVGVMVSFLTYTLWLFWPIIHIVNQWSVLISGLVSVERVTDVFEWKVEGASPTEGDVDTHSTTASFNSEPFPEKLGEIEFRNVWFYYPSQDSEEATSHNEPDPESVKAHERWVLQDISFKVNPGEHIGIIGHTGCGKSTLLSLLFRLYEPQQGEIFLNGIPLSDWPISVLRRYIGLLQQDGALFSGTIQDNLTLFSDLNKLSSLEGTLFAPPDLRRDVTQLSVGEKQAVLFTRSFLRGPRLWVLDEAAAHLDPIMDKALHDIVADRGRKQTLLVVAHRLSTVQELDFLLVLHNGQVVERGLPKTLLESDGLYAKMFRAQEISES